MYKRQLTWQKILCFAALAVSALVFLYSLGLMTDLYDSLYSTMMDPNNIDDTWVTGSQVYYHMQPFNKTLLGYSIGMILLSCLLFITSTTVSPDCREAVLDAVNTWGNFQTVTETNAGCTVSCHCGPGTLGILFMKK